MSRLRLTVLFPLLLMCSATFAEDGIMQQFASACRVSCPDGSAGTGSVIEKTDSWFVILTNEHVVGRNKTATCEFWRLGHQSKRLPAQVYTADHERDLATVVIPAKMFGEFPPSVLKLATANPQPGECVQTVGCPEAKWASGVIGHVLGTESDGRISFVPAPMNGRSGSALCNTKGELVGVVEARTDANGGHGLAIGVDTVKRILRTSTQQAHDTFTLSREFLDLCQCGPGGCPIGPYGGGGMCPGGQCPGGMCPMPQQGMQMPQQQAPWMGGPAYGQARRGPEPDPESAPIYPTMGLFHRDTPKSCTPKAPGHLLPYRNETDRKLQQLQREIDELQGEGGSPYTPKGRAYHEGLIQHGLEKAKGDLEAKNDELKGKIQEMLDNHPAIKWLMIIAIVGGIGFVVVLFLHHSAGKQIASLDNKINAGIHVAGAANPAVAALMPFFDTIHKAVQDSHGKLDALSNNLQQQAKSGGFVVNMAGNPPTPGK